MNCECPMSEQSCGIGIQKECAAAVLVRDSSGGVEGQDVIYLNALLVHRESSNSSAKACADNQQFQAIIFPSGGPWLAPHRNRRRISCTAERLAVIGDDLIAIPVVARFHVCSDRHVFFSVPTQ